MKDEDVIKILLEVIQFEESSFSHRLAIDKAINAVCKNALEKYKVINVVEVYEGGYTNEINYNQPMITKPLTFSHHEYVLSNGEGKRTVRESTFKKMKEQGMIL